MSYALNRLYGVTTDVDLMPSKVSVRANSSYKPIMCTRVLEVGEYGGWISEMAEACDVGRATFDYWQGRHPDFREAVERAKQKAQAWFEAQGRIGMRAHRFNAQLWQRQVAGRHPEVYTERRETTNKNMEVTIESGDADL